jgi:uncharacterized protein with HEPN domain
VSRDVRLYLEDIRLHCDEIAEHVRGLTYDEFVAARETYKAVAFSLIVIGESVKHVPQDLRTRYPEVEWRRIAGLRDVIAHGYFALRDPVLWEVVSHSVPELRGQVERILNEVPHRPG